MILSAITTIALFDIFNIIVSGMWFSGKKLDLFGLKIAIWGHYSEINAYSSHIVRVYLGYTTKTGKPKNNRDFFQLYSRHRWEKYSVWIVVLVLSTQQLIVRFSKKKRHEHASL